MYTIGKLSKNTGVTVRTLDYYDEIGLVKPSSKTSGGHRLYDEDDVMRLERVLALKYMGFSLEQLKMLEQALRGVSYSIEMEGQVNWSIIFMTIQLFQQNQEEIFQQYNEFLTEEDMKKILKMNEQITEEDSREWGRVISEIRSNLDADPASEFAQKLVEQWMNQAEKMFGGDKTLLRNLWESLQNLKEGIVFYPMDKEIINFIEKVASEMENSELLSYQTEVL